MSFSIYPPLHDKVLDAQFVFRRILSAESFPGTVVSVEEVSQPWGKLSAAGAAIIQTLCDSNTSIYFSPSLEDSAIIESTSFHSAAQLSPPQTASFVFTTADDTTHYTNFDHGDEYTPERSATVVMQIEAWDGGDKLTLSGPGIEQTRTISPLLPESLLAYLSSPNKPTYPCGIDFLFTHGSELMAIPRTTNVTLENN